MARLLRSDAAVCEITDALLLFDEPLLGRRFREMLARHADTQTAERLRPLPHQAVAAERRLRRAALEWVAGATGSLADAYVAEGEARFLESLVDLAERQARTVAWMAKCAPVEEVRSEFEQASTSFALVAREMREAVLASGVLRDRARTRRVSAACAQEEDVDHDLRGQVGAVVEMLRSRGTPPSRLILSPTAFRHLRDQGFFRAGETTLFDVPVALDLGWPTSSFAVETAELRPLDEVRAGVGPDAG